MTIHPWTVRAWKGGKLITTRHPTDEAKDRRVAAWRREIRDGTATRIDILDHRNAQTRTIYF